MGFFSSAWNTLKTYAGKAESYAHDNSEIIFCISAVATVASGGLYAALGGTYVAAVTGVSFLATSIAAAASRSKYIERQATNKRDNKNEKEKEDLERIIAENNIEKNKRLHELKENLEISKASKIEHAQEQERNEILQKENKRLLQNNNELNTENENLRAENARIRMDQSESASPEDRQSATSSASNNLIPNSKHDQSNNNNQKCYPNINTIRQDVTKKFQNIGPKLLDAIGKEKNDSKQLSDSDIHIVRKDVSDAISDLNAQYTGDFINLLLYGNKQEALSIQVHKAITDDKVEDYFEQIKSSVKYYHFIPLNVAYDEKQSQLNKNHWVVLIIDIRHQLIFYLDPAIKQAVPPKVKELKNNLNYQSEIILNPIDFQKTEKQEGRVRHCGAYSIEILKAFQKSIQKGQSISGSSLPNINQVEDSVSLQTVLSEIPCGSDEDIVKIRYSHLEEACTTLGVNLENLAENQNTQTASLLSSTGLFSNSRPKQNNDNDQNSPQMLNAINNSSSNDENTPIVVPNQRRRMYQNT